MTGVASIDPGPIATGGATIDGAGRLTVIDCG
jgi:hypothetical protein